MSEVELSEEQVGLRIRWLPPEEHYGITLRNRAAHNLNHQTLMEIWNNRIMRRVQMILGKADRNFAPSNVCDVDGTMMGRSHYDRWTTYYQK